MKRKARKKKKMMKTKGREMICEVLSRQSGERERESERD
jgi:hypothetical protein